MYKSQDARDSLYQRASDTLTCRFFKSPFLEFSQEQLTKKGEKQKRQINCWRGWIWVNKTWQIDFLVCHEFPKIFTELVFSVKLQLRKKCFLILLLLTFETKQDKKNNEGGGQQKKRFFRFFYSFYNCLILLSKQLTEAVHRVTNRLLFFSSFFLNCWNSWI